MGAAVRLPFLSGSCLGHPHPAEDLGAGRESPETSPPGTGHQEHHLGQVMSKKDDSCESNTVCAHLHMYVRVCVGTGAPGTEQPTLQQQLSPLSPPPANALTLPEALRGLCTTPDPLLRRAAWWV